MEVQAGSLAYYYHNWQLITNDKVILSWVLGYDIPFNGITPIRNKLNHHRRMTSKECHILKTEIHKLKSMNVISKCSYQKDQFLSPIFTVPKQNGENRFILNLKELNKYITIQHFKLEDLRTVCKLLTKDCFMATIDLKEAYFSVNISQNSKKFLRFKFLDNLYQFNALPFGLCTAPYVFTKILKPVISYLREQNIIVSIYLDDIICIGKDFETCYKNILEICALLQSLGFVINTEKSCLLPSKCCKYLGFILDSERMTMSLPVSKINLLSDFIKSFKYKRQCKIREFSQLLGLLNSACPGMKYGLLYTKLLEREKFLSLRLNKDNYDAHMQIPKYLHSEFNWWLHNLSLSNNPIRQYIYDIELFTDASRSGWGAVCETKKAAGLWTKEEQRSHINYLELKAAFFGLKCLTTNLTNCDILIRIDNTTAVSYINRMGGIQYPHLNSITREIWQFCEIRNIFLFASYINTKENIEADYQSRKHTIEWELSDVAFQTIITEFGEPDIDLFASRTNSKCQHFMSWRKDPDAIAVDAFTVKWSKYFFYAFPPFNLVLRVIQKIKIDKASGILVVPYWKTQPWFPLFTDLLQSPPIIFQPSKELLSSHFRDHHPLYQTLTLAAGLLSARH